MSVKIKNGEDSFLNEYNRRPAPIVIFGAGSLGRQAAVNMQKAGFKIDFFCDNSDNKINTFIDDIYCISPNELVGKFEFSYIIIVVNFGFVMSIVHQLKRYDFCATIYINVNFCNNSDESTKTRNLPWHYYYLYDKIKDEFLPDYLEQLKLLMPYFSVDTILLKDVSSEYVNVIKNIRVTTGCPNDSLNNVYIFGDSRYVGLMVEDSETIASFLQKNINTKCLPYSVINNSCIADSLHSSVKKLYSSKLKANDIVLFSPSSFLTQSPNDMEVYNHAELDEIVAAYIVDAYKYCKKYGAYFYLVILGTAYAVKNPTTIEEYLKKINKVNESSYNTNNIINFSSYIKDICIANNIAVIDTVPAIQRPHDYGEIFIDTDHYGPNGNRLIADNFFKFIEISYNNSNLMSNAEQRMNKIEDDLNNFYKTSRSLELEIWIDETLEKINDIDTSSKEIGSIVMNCNPFTNGHRYLIEQASQLCDYLLIFVVQEDKSFFKYEDRFNMIKLGTIDIQNVRVLPGGTFIISSATFPQYFEKEQFQNTVDASEDLNIFAQHIAPALGITKRFVGTEPFCKVTNSYNEQIKRVLGGYGINVIQIERLKFANRAISATEVRRLIKEKKMEELKNIVPKTTYEYLTNMFREISI